MANSITLRDKPANAKYVAKAVLDPYGNVEMTSMPEPKVVVEIDGKEHDPNGPSFSEVEVAWYGDRVKVTIPGGGPASITQAYLTGNGKEVIVEIAQAAERDSDD